MDSLDEELRVRGEEVRAAYTMFPLTPQPEPGGGETDQQDIVSKKHHLHRNQLGTNCILKPQRMMFDLLDMRYKMNCQ